MNPRRKRILFVIGSIALSLAGLELTARIYLGWIASPSSFQRYASLSQIAGRMEVLDQWVSRPHHYLGYVPSANYAKGSNRHNSLGFRGAEIELKKPKGEFRIACLGGSTTYTSVVEDHRRSFPHLLEQQLQSAGHRRVRVINAGVNAYTSWESLLNYQLRVQPLEPDLLIVYHGINDLRARCVWPSSAYRRDNSGYRSPRLSFDKGSAWPESAALRILLVRTGLRRPAVGVDNFFFGPTDTVPMYRRPFLTTKQDLDDMFGDMQKALASNRPIYFRRNIENVVALAAARGTRVLLPSFKLSDHPMDPRLGPLEEEVKRAIAEQNEALADIAANSSALYYDFAGEFPADTQYFADFVHVNEEGAALKAERFASFLIANRLVPEP